MPHKAYVDRREVMGKAQTGEQHRGTEGRTPQEEASSISQGVQAAFVTVIMETAVYGCVTKHHTTQ